MRSNRAYRDRYQEIMLLDCAKASVVAMADLCLHFLAKHLPNESVTVLPALLQGHLAAYLPSEAQRHLFTLRQLAGSFCSKLAWRKALSALDESSQSTGYVVSNSIAMRRKMAPQVLFEHFDGTLDSVQPYTLRECKFAVPGAAKIPFKGGVEQSIVVPEVDIGSISPVNLTKRSVNPPISIKFVDLRKIAESVDVREATLDFPEWLEKLHLAKRLGKVGIENLDGFFFRDGMLTLDGTSHVVGMLSSGKSTLLYALLFLLVSPSYNKRVLVLASDTVAASKIVARLQAHGIAEATVVSSLRNRDEHLSTAHWSARDYPTDLALEATASLTKSLGVACPLEGFQQNASDVATLSMLAKPCTNLVQSHGKIKRDRLTCPLFDACPAQSQQRMLCSAKVFLIIKILQLPGKIAVLSASKA